MTPFDLFILHFAITTFDAQNGCSNSTNCINVRKCPAIVEILKDAIPLSEETLQILRDATCGFEDNEPMICCTNQTMKRLSDSETIPAPPNVTDHPNLRLLDHETCGASGWLGTSIGHINRQGIGGDRTGVYQYPWMALIAYDVGRANPEFRCGGSIISSRYILTAAHCIAELPGFRLIGVRVGDHDISKERDCFLKYGKRPEIDCAERYQDFGVDNIHVHPQYPTSNLHNDIALIRLNGSVDFRATNVKPICLPFGSATTLYYRNAIVTGWGNTEPLGPRSRELLRAGFELMSYEQCKEIYKQTVQIWHKQLCAGSESDVDSCLGDSGGPLTSIGFYNEYKSLRYVQYGVVSYTRNKCGAEVFTKVAYYMDWILNTMAD